ncbi:ATP-binding cassette domain-containing protein [Pseudonocardia alni]|uniref:Heme exporter protein A n=2 Tax=Pseudonocardia alni TaxID=33907 RepID=A0AA44UUR4_PSEA5|nr:ABC transporter ATP-binding protein [Pseudonocardia alni]NWJ75005.1 ABC transporter ATP-binding protein [Pseudonocardia pini]PKB41168.1 heme exporter protein A [Pseudonocardia alni]
MDLHQAPVLRDLDLCLESGEVIGLMGANGSGKSTLLSVLATLIRPTAGTVELFGRQIDATSARTARLRVALVGHSAALYDRLTLEENLRLVARLTGRPRRRVPEVLADVGLARAAGRPAIACSQGMRRRAELARVMLTEPDLLLLDEVHTGLDYDAAPLVGRVLAEVRSRWGAGVLVSHEAGRVSDLCDRTVGLRSGRVETVVAR